MGIVQHCVGQARKAIAVRQVQRVRDAAAIEQRHTVYLDQDLGIGWRNGDALRQSRGRDGQLGLIQVGRVVLAFGSGLLEIQGDDGLVVLNQPDQARAIVGTL